MFPKEFKLQTAVIKRKSHHRAILFSTQDKSETTAELIMKMGIQAFLTSDSPGTDRFKDNRIINYPTYQTFADCCAFTKTAGQFYLFPIHKDELANVGIDEQDLIYWITKLNETNTGFEYLYFGEHDAPAKTQPGKNLDWSHHVLPLTDNKFYWVGVPKLGMNSNKPYLHWVALRYLISTEVSGVNADHVAKGLPRLPYFNIPRITVMLHEQYGLDFLKAFLYAHIASPFRSSNGMVFSDIMGANMGPGNDYRESAQAPCVNITNEQFKVLWDNCGDYLNHMLTQSEYNKRLVDRPAIAKAGITHLRAPYDHSKTFSLFNEGKYQEFINEIENSYKEHEEKVAI